jgi:hypothetical protein
MKPKHTIWKSIQKKNSLTLKLNLYSYDDFYSKEILHQIILSLFFGAMDNRKINFLYYLLSLIIIVYLINKFKDSTFFSI